MCLASKSELNVHNMPRIDDTVESNARVNVSEIATTSALPSHIVSQVIHGVQHWHQCCLITDK